MDENALLMALLRTQVCGDSVELNEMLSPELLKKLYIVARRHDLAHIVGQALGERGLLGEDEISKRLKECSVQAIYRYIQLNRELEQCCCALEESSIPFIPLKGSVLRECYPEPWMRTSCDIDILVREPELDAAVEVLTQKLHYHGGRRGDHDVILRAPSGVIMELHYDTIQERYANNTSRDVLSGVWEDAKPMREGSCHMVMSDAMFYFYHIAHMAKHFEVGGCGVRSFLDLWILTHKVEHQREEREALLGEGGLLRFAQAAEKLSEAWFSGEPMDDRTRQFNDFILRAGLYGDEENRAALGQAKMGGKLRYILSSRVFLPYEYLKAEYPVLEQRKWLAPFCQVARWTRVLKRSEWRRRVRELKVNTSVSESEAGSAEDMLRYLGLD